MKQLRDLLISKAASSADADNSVSVRLDDSNRMLIAIDSINYDPCDHRDNLKVKNFKILVTESNGILGSQYFNSGWAALTHYVELAYE